MTKDSKNLSMLETERLFLRQPSEEAISDIVKFSERNLQSLVCRWISAGIYF